MYIPKTIFEELGKEEFLHFIDKFKETTVKTQDTVAELDKTDQMIKVRNMIKNNLHKASSDGILDGITVNIPEKFINKDPWKAEEIIVLVLNNSGKLTENENFADMKIINKTAIPQAERVTVINDGKSVLSMNFQELQKMINDGDFRQKVKTIIEVMKNQKS